MHEHDNRIQSIQYVNMGLKGETKAGDHQINRYKYP